MFLKVGLGFWDDESFKRLVEPKIRQYKLEYMIEDGYGDQLLAAVMIPRSGMLRIFPYIASYCFFIQQMSTTPTCFLFPYFYTSSPFYETLRKSVLKNRGVEETETWALFLLTPVTFYDDHFLLRYILNFSIFATAVAIAFAPEKYRDILVISSLTCFIILGLVEALRSVVSIMGRVIGLTDEDFIRVFSCGNKLASCGCNKKEILIQSIALDQEIASNNSTRRSRQYSTKM